MKSFILAGTVSFTLLALFSLHDAEAQKKKKKEDNVPIPKREDVPKLLNTLKKSTGAGDRAFAAAQIGRLGQIQALAVKECIEPLIGALGKDADAGVRRAAAQALGMIAPDPEKTLPPLMEALKDKNLDVGLAAVTALGRYGPEARSALPALREFAKTKVKDKKLGQIVNAAIKEIAGKKKGG